LVDLIAAFNGLPKKYEVKFDLEDAEAPETRSPFYPAKYLRPIALIESLPVES